MGESSAAGKTEIQFLLGPYRSGKTRRLVEDLANFSTERKLSGPGALLVVPSVRYQNLIQERLLGQIERRTERASRGAASAPVSILRELEGVVGLQISSFYKVCSSLLRQAGVSFRLIPESVRPAIVARAMESLDQSRALRHLKPLMRYKGTCAAVLELIDELQRAGMSPDDVLSRLYESASVSSRHVELASIYKAYWEKLDEIGFLDNHRLAFACREVLAARSDGQSVFGYVGVDGFDRFNRLQLQVLQALSYHCDKMTVCFDFTMQPQDEDEAHEYAWKQTSFDDLRSTFSHAFILDSAPAGERLAPRLEALSAVDRYMEMEEIARRVKGALVVDGLKASEIVVVVPSMKKYRGAVESAFDDAQIPYFIDEAVGLATLPSVQFLLALLKVSQDDFTRSDLMALLKSPYFNLRAFDLTEQDVREIDSLSQEKEVIASASDWCRLDNVKLGALIEFLRPQVDHCTLTEFVTFTEDLITKCLNVPDRSEFADPVEVWTLDRSVYEFRNCLSALVQEDMVLETCQRKAIQDGERTFSFDEYVGKLMFAVEGANFRRVRSSLDPVLICSVDLVPNRRFEHLFIAGMAEGEFPRKPRQGAFINQDEVGRLKAYGIDIENPRAHPAFEYALFRSLINRTAGTVTLSYPRWDMAGEELLPSFFLTGELPDVPVEEVGPYEMALTMPVSAREFVSGYLSHSDQPPERSREQLSSFGFPQLRDIASSLADPVSMAAARTCFSKNSPFNGYLCDYVSTGSLAVSIPHRWSVSRLNDYGKCPFKYWVSHVLKLEPFQEPSADIDVRTLGETYHKALEILYESIIEKGIEQLNDHTELVEELFKTAIDEAIRWMEETSSVTYGEFWQLKKKEIIFRLKRFLVKELERELKDSNGYRATLVEAPFGMDSDESAPALKISDGARTVEIRGFIDRIDTTVDGRIMVVDYKAGSQTISAREAYSGRNMQVPVYALAAQRCILPGGRAAAGAYLSVSSGNQIGKLDFSREKDAEVLRRVEEHILEFAEFAKSGRFSVDPRGSKACKGCDHNKICRIAEMSKGALNVPEASEGKLQASDQVGRRGALKATDESTVQSPVHMEPVDSRYRM